MTPAGIEPATSKYVPALN